EERQWGQMTGADGDSPRIEVPEDVGGRVSRQHEREDGHSLRRRVRSKQPQPRDVAQLLERILRELPLVAFEYASVLSAQVLNGSREADRPRNVRRAGGELASRVLEFLGREIDLMCHIRSGLIGRHVFEQLAPSPEDPDTHGTEHLVAGERQEVTAESLHIKRNVRSGLRGIDHYAGTGAAGPRADL